MADDQSLADERQKQINEAIDEKLRQEEEWEEQYGQLFREKKEDKLKPAGGTLAGQAERMKANKGFTRRKAKPAVFVKIKGK